MGNLAVRLWKDHLEYDFARRILWKEPWKKSTIDSFFGAAIWRHCALVCAAKAIATAIEMGFLGYSFACSLTKVGVGIGMEMGRLGWRWGIGTGMD